MRQQFSFFEGCIKKERNTIWIALLLTVVLWLSQAGSRLYPNDIDNYQISLITNGLYSSSEFFTLFVSPILSLFIHGIDLLFPEADGFAIFLEIGMFASLWLIMYLIICISQEWSAVIMLFLFLMCITWRMNLFHVNFTIWAGFTSLSGYMGLLYYLENPKQRGVLYASFGTFLAGCLVRLNSVLLLLPFFALGIAFYSIHTKNPKLYVDPLRNVLLGCLIIYSLILGVSNIYKSSPEMENAVKYSDARSALQDYPHKKWEDVSADMEDLGVSRNDYELITDLVYADVDWINADRLEGMVPSSAVSITLDLENIIKTIKNIILSILYSKEMLIQVFMALLLLIWIMTKKRIGSLQCLELLFSVGGALILLCFFQIKGRLPYRVQQVIVFGLWMNFFQICLFRSSLETIQKKVQTRIKAVLLICTLFMVPNSWFDRSQGGNGLFASFTARDSESIELPDLPEAPKIWRVYTLNGFMNRFYMSAGKLPSPSFMNGNIASGEWVYAQPFYTQYLHRIGLDNPMKALADEEALYVGRDEDMLKILIYIQEHFDQDYMAKEVYSCEDIKCYAFITE